jgi:uncharacterized protein (TIGR01777 family)
MRTLITGTGLIGRALLPRLEKAVVLTRDPARAGTRLGAVEAHAWEPATGPPPLAALRDVDIVFNLAGEPVAEGRWTAERKRRIRDSRVLGTRHLVAAIAEMERRPRVLVSASAVGYYGDRGDEELDESSAAGRGFLAEVCVEWEREALAATQLGVRVVCVRTGIALAPGGGALARMLPPFRMGLGGPLAGGRQWMPWVHLEDVVGLLLHASRDARVRGPMNGVGPRPVTNAEFTRALGLALHRPALLPVPRMMLRAAFGEMGEVLTASQRVFPRVAEHCDYVFGYAELRDALGSILRSRTGGPPPETA